MTKLDLSYLLATTDGDKDFMNELIDIFISELPIYLENFNTALEQKDIESLSRIAHKARSSVTIMGLTDLSKQLTRFEEETREGVFQDKYIGYVEYFEEEYNNAIIQLKNIE